jgi:hypothetical protein
MKERHTDEVALSRKRLIDLKQKNMGAIRQNAQKHREKVC